MNKNLKKVISAVAALAMTASTFVAFAANYPDVDASASYKQAVDELSALNVINGYTDGTFQPDKLVSRAEFAKMVVIASGKAMEAQAEAAANTNTKFNDVKGDHWAAGYVTAATANKIINGMDDKTFAPDANITYAQAMKMLVCAAGYEQWSADKGGWPTGYMYWGNQLGVGNGVKDVVQDTEITRAQCAQMIDNALNVPVCVETGGMNFDRYGNPYAELEPKDDYGKDFQSILTKQHKAYKVKGMVTGTHKSGDSKSDEVSFKIMSARNWNNEEDQISKKNQNQETINALIGASEADKFLHKYVEALIAVDEDDEYTILSISVTGQNDDYTLSAADYDSDEKFDSEKMHILQNGKASSKKIAVDAKMFVNGVEVGDYDIDNVNAYIKNNNVGNITLIDTPGESNSTDGKFDYIMVDVYKTAVVDSVNVIDDETIEISLTDGDEEFMNLGTWTIDLSDEETSYAFTLDGAACDIASLEMYDVLSIQADPTVSADKSRFYDVQVSKASTAVSGQISTVKEPDEEDAEIDTEYVVDGTTYKIATINYSDLKAGESYTFYVDVFGRIAYTDDLASDKKIAILDAAYTNAAGKGKAELVLPDGTTQEYSLRDVKVSSEANVPSGVTVENNVDWAKYVVYGKVNADTATDAKVDAWNRVVEYAVNANNELVVKKVLGGATREDLEYKASSNKLGSYTIDPETTAFLNAKDQKDIKAMNVSAFTNGNTYQAYFFDKAKSTNAYRLVIVTSGAGDYRPTTNIAVVQKVVSKTNAEGDSVTALDVVIGGEAAPGVEVDDTVKSDAQALKTGDIVVYETDASGVITTINKVLVDTDLSSATAYLDVFDEVITKGNKLVDDAVADLLAKGGNDEVTFMFGPIIDSSDNSITLGEVEDGKTNKTDAEDYSYASDVKVATINYNNRDNKVAAATNKAVTSITFPKSVFEDSDQNIIAWENLSSRTNPRFAFIKIVEKEVTDVVVIIPKTGLDRDAE